MVPGEHKQTRVRLRTETQVDTFTAVTVSIFHLFNSCRKHCITNCYLMHAAYHLNHVLMKHVLEMTALQWNKANKRGALSHVTDEFYLDCNISQQLLNNDPSL